MKDVRSLVARMKKGERTAFDELYERHYFSLQAYASLFLDRQDAEDVVQDVFLNVWVHRDRVDEAQPFHSYLLRAVYNAALNVLKRKSRSADYRPDVNPEIEELVQEYYHPDANDVIRRIYNQELQADLTAAIESLPPKCREVFSMSYLEDTPSKEISLRLGISLRTVDNHIYAALKLLREKLAQHKVQWIWLCFFLWK